MATQHLEDIIYNFLRTKLTVREKKELSTGYTVDRHIDEESEQEIKDELYRYVKDDVNWTNIVKQLQRDIEDMYDEDEDEESEEDDEEYEEED
jgi:hypothetical protein